jgi:cytochrome P450
MSEARAEPPARPEVAVDLASQDFLDHRLARYAELRDRCPVAWDTLHDGFWLVTGYDGVLAVARDTDTFMHKYELGAADGVDYHGIIGVPRLAGVPRQGVSEIDGVDHQELRRVLNPVFSPPAVARLRPQMERVTTWFLDQVIEAGTADLVNDLTTPVPAVLTLQMMGMPTDKWERYAEFFHASTAHASGTPEHTAAIARAPEMLGELREWTAYRRQHRSDDVTDLLVTLERGGRRLTDDEVVDVMWNLVAGGIDTTTSLTSWALHHLGTHPADRRRLVDEPALVPTAIEEFLRFYSPSETLTRTAARDVELCGHRVEQGDRVWISWLSANRDPTAFDRPDEVVIDRSPIRHLSFGLGAHRCIGANLARAETEVMLLEALRRIPDYVIDPDRFRPYPGNPLMTGVVTMPATFTPGPRVGATARPF